MGLLKEKCFTHYKILAQGNPDFLLCHRCVSVYISRFPPHKMIMKTNFVYLKAKVPLPTTYVTLHFMYHITSCYCCTTMSTPPSRNSPPKKYLFGIRRSNTNIVFEYYCYMLSE